MFLKVTKWSYYSESYNCGYLWVAKSFHWKGYQRVHWDARNVWYFDIGLIPSVHNVNLYKELHVCGPFILWKLCLTKIIANDDGVKVTWWHRWENLLSRENEMYTQSPLTLWTEETWGFWLSIQGLGHKSRDSVCNQGRDLTEARNWAVRMQRGRDKNDSEKKMSQCVKWLKLRVKRK